MLILILAEAALETVPEDLWSHIAVKRHSKRRRKPPKFLILNRSYHHSAMRNLKQSEKRGRPDIVHFTLLEALGSPLNREGLLKAYVHTNNDFIVSVNSEARLPRNCERFVGLLEQLFEKGKVPSRGQILLRLERKTLPELLEEIRPDFVMAFSRKGKRNTLEKAATRLLSKEKPAVIIGGFPHGRFSKTTIRLADEVVSVDPQMLETWILTSRVIYDYERGICLPKKRLKK